MLWNAGFLSLLALAIIHLFANQVKVLGWVWHGRFLSFAAGISFAYVFVDLLPELEKSQPALKHTFENIIPYFDKHAYVIALIGVLFYYGLHTATKTNNGTRNFWLSISGYLLFNFFVGVSLSDSSNPDIQPIALFTIAMGMHYFVNDHNATTEATELYSHWVRWLLVVALFFGYFVGYFARVPDAIAAITISFISGGVLLNALRYELPKREQIGYCFFVVGALLYTVL
ncbi:MAG: hypothetical protein H0X51_09270 [Parachlamydiaceae bacterium]|nr:hypothetical protein [Parachlamydiaceae bacterium]